MEDAKLELKDLVREGYIHGRIYTDPEIFELEMQRIFQKSWLYVAHESELMNPGDYKTTTLGGQPILVVRDADDGQIHAFYNRCRHRAATVCQHAHGNANYFRCAYHGWTYSNSGDLVGVPFPEAYGEDFKREDLGLVRVAQVDTYRGFIFVKLSPGGPSLKEHLGNAIPYLDRIVEQSPEGISISANAHRTAFNGNWKLQLENTADAYHFVFVHRSYLKIVQKRTGQKAEVQYTQNARNNPKWRVYDLGNGHAAYEYASDEEGRKSDLSIGGLPFILIVFPNLGFVGAQLRVTNPIRVDYTEVDLYPMMLNGVDPEVNEQRLRDHEGFYGPAGFGYPDDMEIAFRRVTEGLKARGNEWLVVSRGLHREQIDENGVRSGQAVDELTTRAIAREWERLMVEGA